MKQKIYCFRNTKNFETLIKQTHTKPQKTLGFELTKPTERFSFKPSIPIERSCMIGLTSLEGHISFLNITEANNKFELYRDLVDELKLPKLNDELEILDFSIVTLEHLQDKIIGPRIIKAHKRN